MSDLNKIVDQLSKLTVVEAAELSKQLEEKWGVTAAEPVVAAPVAAAAVKEKSEFTQNNYFINTGSSDGDGGGSDNTDNYGKTTVNEGTPRDYVTKETLEENR